jgi:hypothetical protein
MFESRARLWLGLLGAITIFPPCQAADAGRSSLHPTVEIEEDVCSYEPANNGAGPMWCRGSTCLVRIGEGVFASGLETLKDAQPLNNCRWVLFHRGPEGWKRVQADPNGRTREPCPLAAFPDGRLFLSANPTRATVPEPHGGPAQPEILQFTASDPAQPFERILPGWSDHPSFTEHSYRSFVADGPNRELILFQNIGYTHSEWAFRDRAGHWSAQGQLPWPYGSGSAKPGPIRVCYPAVALRNRAVHFCGVSDIMEPNSQWRAYKKKLTGRDWDYDFRRLFYTWSPDVTTEKFRPWVEVASRDQTGGRVTPGDLWLAPDGAVHLLWTEVALDERLRPQFFPTAKQSYELNYAVLRDGKVTLRRTLMHGSEHGEAPSLGRFQVTPDQRLFAFYFVSGTNAAGIRVSENRIQEILPDGSAGPAVRVPLRSPFTNFFTATIRAGSPASDELELLGTRANAPRTIAYARVRLF